MADEVISGPADGDGSRLPFSNDVSVHTHAGRVGARLMDKGCRLDDAVDYSEGEAE